MAKQFIHKIKRYMKRTYQCSNVGPEWAVTGLLLVMMKWRRGLGLPLKYTPRNTCLCYHILVAITYHPHSTSITINHHPSSSTLAAPTRKIGGFLRKLLLRLQCYLGHLCPMLGFSATFSQWKSLRLIYININIGLISEHSNIVIIKSL